MISQFDNIDMKCVLENFFNSKMTQIAYQQAQPDQILKNNANDRILFIHQRKEEILAVVSESQKEN